MRTWEGYQKGVNLGGWLSQFGQYDETHFNTWITEEDFKKIAAMGFDHVRIPVDYIMLETDDKYPQKNPFGYQKLHEAISWARACGLHIVLDLHEVYGYSFDPMKKDMDREKFFHDPSLQRRYCSLWANIAGEFRDDTDITAFELLNEVVLSDVYEAWNEAAEHAVEMIRMYAPKAWIVIGGVRYNNANAVAQLAPVHDDHIVYNFHCYEPLVFTHQSAYWVANMPSGFHMPYPDSLAHYRETSKRLSNDLTGAINQDDLTEMGPDYFSKLFAPAVKKAEENNAPLYCGEYGVIDQAPAEDTLRWFKDIHSVFLKDGIGRAVWNYKGKDFGIIDPHYDPIRTELIENC